MRRLTVLQVLPSLHAGGVERSTLEVAAALAAAGHDSHVVSAGGRLVGPLEAAGSQHHRLAVGRKSLATLGLIPSLRRLLADLAPDVVHARSRLPAWLCRAAMRGLRSRPAFVTTVHGLNSPGWYSGVMASGDAVVCVSESVRAHVLRHWPAAASRLRVIPRGVDPTEFPRRPSVDAHARAALSRELPLLAEPGPLLLLPGRGTRLKGHAAAIQLLASLRASGIPAVLWMPGAVEAGREAYLSELRAEAGRLGVSGSLLLTPSRADIALIYAAADLVLQTSEKPEAFGRTVLEALSVGVPVLGWAHGGVGDLLGQCYPAGAVPLGDSVGLQVAAKALLLAPPPLPASIPFTRAAMQTATLELYADLIR